MTQEEAHEEILEIVKSLGVSPSESHRMVRAFMRKVRREIKEAPEPDYIISEVYDGEMQIRMRTGNRTQAQDKIDEHVDVHNIPGTWKVEEEKDTGGWTVYIARKQAVQSSSSDSSTSSDSIVEAFEDLSQEKQNEFLEKHSGE